MHQASARLYAYHKVPQGLEQSTTFLDEPHAVILSQPHAAQLDTGRRALESLAYRPTGVRPTNRLCGASDAYIT